MSKEYWFSSRYCHKESGVYIDAEIDGVMSAFSSNEASLPLRFNALSQLSIDKEAPRDWSWLAGLGEVRDIYSSE